MAATRHRLVFYIGGFDPRGPSREYRDLRQAVDAHPVSAAAESIHLGRRESLSPLLSAWTVRWEAPGEPPCETRYHVLRWDDLVRRHWARGGGQALADLGLVSWLSVRRGLVGRLWRRHRAGVWMNWWPQLLALALMGLGAAVGGWLQPGGTAGLWAAVGGGAGLLLWPAVAQRLDALWLLRLYAFFCQHALDRRPDLSARLDAWASEVASVLASQPAKEVMFVAHSTGSILAALLLARLCRREALAPHHESLGLLTLGHCTPVLAWVDARSPGFQDDLALLRARQGLTWIDVSAPTDWAAFARVAPWLGPASGAHLRQVSPRFHVTLGQGAYDALLANRHALHLQYLRAPRFGGGYDPVTWTLGPMTLAERWSRLSPAPS